MHNGSVGGFSMIKRHIRERLSDHAYNAIQGSTDSEHVLALMGDAYDSAAEEDPLDRMAAALCQAVNQVESLRTAAGVEEQSWLNMAVTDGECAVVSRYVSDGSEGAHSLYWASGCLVVERGEGRVVEGGEGTPAVVVASEPLGPDTAWKPVPPNHLVRVSGDRSVEVVKM
jgi:predicted glutamine amidotransferase